MSNATSTKGSWLPPPDDELNWFPAKGNMLLTPRPLEYTVEVKAFIFGITRALESLEFPLTEVRSRLVDGRLYYAIAPSADAEKNIRRRLQSVQDLSLRYTKDIRGYWQQQVQSKIEGYNRWMAEFVRSSDSSKELAEQVRQLRRVRANQWFNLIRSVVAPTALIQLLAKEAIEQKGRDSAEVQSLVRGADDGVAVTKEAFGVADRGKTILLSALREVGVRLTDAGSINDPEDIFWLEWMDVRVALQNGGDRRAIVAKRKEEASVLGRLQAPLIIGSTLPPDTTRMYLVPEILRLLS